MTELDNLVSQITPENSHPVYFETPTMTDIDYSTLSKEDAEKLMHEKVSEAYAALAEAEALADTHKLSFGFSPCYGMGGRYYGDPEDHNEDCDGWYPSSQSC